MSTFSISYLLERAASLGLTIDTYNPGDGTKYRVFPGTTPKDYFQGGHLCTLHNSTDIMLFLDGFAAGKGGQP